MQGDDYRLHMKDKKAAKKIIRLAKEHPGWYAKDDVRYAKMIKRKIKLMKKEKKENDVS